MAKVIDTRPLAKRFLAELKRERSGVGRVSLASIIVGRESSSQVYVSSQAKLAKALRIDYRFYEFEKKVSLELLLKKIKALNRNTSVKGVIIHRPLPSGWDEACFSVLSPQKDIEGITPSNLGRLFFGQPLFIPPTVASVLEILKRTRINLYGKDTVIVGFSSHIGKPLSIILADRFSTVSITHIATYDKKKLPFYVRQANIVISCVGRPRLIKGAWIKKGAVVIDVGISRYRGKIVGDVDFQEAKKRASFITPVPGGVGPLTTLFLFKNLLKAVRLNKTQKG
jgi:methylenetetrahydrofolate dehydrogenase (NADP+)/methenyltetrahydrofolate cyclohydrolase